MLMSKHKQALAEVEKTHTERLEALKAQIKPLETQVKHKNRQLDTLESQIEATTRDLDGKRRDVSATQKQAALLLADLEASANRLSGTNQRIEEVQAQLRKAESEAAITKRDNEERNTQIVARIALEEHNLEEVEAKRDAAIKHLGDLQIKQGIVAAEIRQFEGQMESERMQHAARVKAADERDEVLKRRELKVGLAEAEMRQNASLMKL